MVAPSAAAEARTALSATPATSRAFTTRCMIDAAWAPSWPRIVTIGLASAMSALTAAFAAAAPAFAAATSTCPMVWPTFSKVSTTALTVVTTFVAAHSSTSPIDRPAATTASMNFFRVAMPLAAAVLRMSATFLPGRTSPSTRSVHWSTVQLTALVMASASDLPTETTASTTEPTASAKASPAFDAVSLIQPPTSSNRLNAATFPAPRSAWRDTVGRRRALPASASQSPMTPIAPPAAK